MNRDGLSPASKYIRRARWILFALPAPAPLALLSQSRRAQKNGREGNYVQFVPGIETTGAFRFYIIIEALP